MRTFLAWSSALALLLSPAAPADERLEEAVADHDQHPGLGHPAGDDARHEHGDADDHHETPDSPCHHHDTHTCCAPGVTLALAGDALSADAGTATRVPVPTLFVHASPSVVEFLHVPLA